MHEVQTFLRSKWNAIESALGAERAAAFREAAEAERRQLAELAAAAEEAAKVKRRAAEEAAKVKRRRRVQIGIILSFAYLVIGLMTVASMRIRTVRTRPLAPMIVGVTPAQYTIDYWFCFEAEDEVRIEPSYMIQDYKYDAYGNDASNGYATRGYSDSVNELFGRRITVTAADPNKPVRFRIWETRESRMYRACGGR